MIAPLVLLYYSLELILVQGCELSVLPKGVLAQCYYKGFLELGMERWLEYGDLN